jgi:hypothetical protein
MSETTTEDAASWVETLIYSRPFQEWLRELGQELLTDIQASEIAREIRSRKHPEDVWTLEWPKEPGFYWFYGWTSAMAMRHFDPEMHFVIAKRASNAVLFHANGEMIWRSSATGFWCPANQPQAPAHVVDALAKR